MKRDDEESLLFDRIVVAISKSILFYFFIRTRLNRRGNDEQPIFQGTMIAGLLTQENVPFIFVSTIFSSFRNRFEKFGIKYNSRMLSTLWNRTYLLSFEVTRSSYNYSINILFIVCVVSSCF